MAESDTGEHSSLSYMLSSILSSTNGLESIPPQTLTMPEMVQEKGIMGCKAEEDPRAGSVIPTADIQSLSQGLGEANGYQNLVSDIVEYQGCPEPAKSFADNMGHCFGTSNLSGTVGVFAESNVLENNGGLLSPQGSLRSEVIPRTDIRGSHGPPMVFSPNVYAALNPNCKVKSLVWPSQKVPPSKVETKIGMREMLSSAMPAETIVRENTESLTIERQYDLTRKGDNAPLKPNNLAIHSVQSPANSSTNSKGALDDDRRQLFAAANSAHTARRLASDHPFWREMEPYFAPVSQANKDFLKKQIKFPDISRSLLPGMLMNENATPVLREIEGANNKRRKGKEPVPIAPKPLFNGAHSCSGFDNFPSLAQTTISALIDEDEVADFNRQNDGRTFSFQHRPLNVMAIGPNNCNRPLTGLELAADSLSPMNRLIDGASLYRNISSFAQRSQFLSSPLHYSGQYSTNGGFLFPARGASTNGGISFPARGPYPMISQDNTSLLLPPNFRLSDASSSSSQYQSRPLDDRIRMELQSVDIHVDSKPPPALVQNPIDQEIAKLQAQLDQQVITKGKILSKIDEAVRCESQLEKRNAEQEALDQLVLMSYKKLKASQSDKPPRRAANKEEAIKEAEDFAKRTLARCEEYEAQGKSSYDEPRLKKALFCPPRKRDRKKACPKKQGNSGTSQAKAKTGEASGANVRKRKASSSVGESSSSKPTEASQREIENATKRDENNQTTLGSSVEHSGTTKADQPEVEQKPDNVSVSRREPSLWSLNPEKIDLDFLNFDDDDIIEIDSVGLDVPMDDLSEIFY